MTPIPVRGSYVTIPPLHSDGKPPIMKRLNIVCLHRWKQQGLGDIHPRVELTLSCHHPTVQLCQPLIDRCTYPVITRLRPLLSVQQGDAGFQKSLGGFGAGRTTDARTQPVWG